MNSGIPRIVSDICSYVEAQKHYDNKKVVEYLDRAKGEWKEIKYNPTTLGSFLDPQKIYRTVDMDY